MDSKKVGDTMSTIYLDNAASTPVHPSVLTKFNEVAENLYANPSSQHMAGLSANRTVFQTQDKIAEKLSCEYDEIYFTSGATMSNNVLIQGMLRKHPEAMFITSAVEHNDIVELYNWLPTQKQMVAVDKNGIIDLEQLDNLIRSCKESGIYSLVSVQMANSETGVIQPVKQISEIVHQHSKAFFHSDATQYIPYYSVDVNTMGIDALSMSGQKIGGIKGSGILYINQVLAKELTPIIFGEQGLIGGTYATPLIASLGEAFELIDYDIEPLKDKTRFLLERLEALGGVLVGPKENRLPNNIYIRFPGINGLTLMNLLSDCGIYIGTGSACSTDSDKPSHVALAYGLTEDEAHECVRFTLSNQNTYEELEEVIKVLESILTLIK